MPRKCLDNSKGIIGAGKKIYKIKYCCAKYRTAYLIRMFPNLPEAPRYCQEKTDLPSGIWHTSEITKHTKDLSIKTGKKTYTGK